MYECSEFKSAVDVQVLWFYKYKSAVIVTAQLMCECFDDEYGNEYRVIWALVYGHSKQGHSLKEVLWHNSCGFVSDVKSGGLFFLSLSHKMIFSL